MILNIKFYVHVNSPAWANENQLKCEKVRFFSKMSEMNSRWVIFNHLEWTVFKSVNKSKMVLCYSPLLDSPSSYSDWIFNFVHHCVPRAINFKIFLFISVFIFIHSLLYQNMKKNSLYYETTNKNNLHTAKNWCWSKVY